jgi:hypothetical protein
MQITAIIAILFSPVVAILISLYVQHRRERRQQQFSVLSTLITSRAQPLNPDSVRALNTIDLVFHKEQGVRRLWHEYYDMLCNEGLNNLNGWKQRNTKNIELIGEMAKVLGYGKTITHLDVDRVYSPTGMWDQINRAQELQAELLRVLKATARVQVQQNAAVEQAPEVAPGPLPPASEGTKGSGGLSDAER